MADYDVEADLDTLLGELRKNSDIVSVRALQAIEHYRSLIPAMAAEVKGYRDGWRQVFGSDEDADTIMAEQRAALVEPTAAPTRPTREQVAELRKLHEEATPAPWAWEATGEKDNSWGLGIVEDEDGNLITGCNPTGENEVIEAVCESINGHLADAALIVAMRNALPEILALLAGEGTAQPDERTADLLAGADDWLDSLPRLYPDHPDGLVGEYSIDPGLVQNLANALRGTAPQPDEVAQWFHEAYERLAPSFGYETRKASAVPWADVPEQNKTLMVAVAGEVLSLLAHLRGTAPQVPADEVDT